MSDRELTCPRSCLAGCRVVLLSGEVQLIIRFEFQPDARFHAQNTLELQSSLWLYWRFSGDDLADQLGRPAAATRKLSIRHLKCLEYLGQHYARRYRVVRLVPVSV